jgi:hypothetical protein
VLARAADANMAGHLGKGSAGCRGSGARLTRGSRPYIGLNGGLGRVSIAFRRQVELGVADDQTQPFRACLRALIAPRRQCGCSKDSPEEYLVHWF